MGQATSEALETVADAGAITDEQILALRQAVYSDGEVDAAEARRILHLHRSGASGAGAAAWADFFVEAIADYYALQREAPQNAPSYAPDYARAAATALKVVSLRGGEAEHSTSDSQAAPGALSAPETTALIMAFRAESGLVLDPTERRALARLFDRCVELSDALRGFALDAVFATAAADGRVDSHEVALLRRVLYGPAGEDGVGISRQEAEILFAIANETSGADNAPEWRDLFVKGVASYLLRAGASPDVVDGGEAAWLVAKLGRAGAMDELRRDLLAYVGREAARVDPRLRPYLAA